MLRDVSWRCCNGRDAPAGLRDKALRHQVETDRHALQIRAVPRAEEDQVSRLREAVTADPYNLSNPLHANEAFLALITGLERTQGLP
jgi:hypothetical protein